MRERHVTDWPCRKCNATDLTAEEISDVYDDWRYRCNKCGHTWIEEGGDS